MKWVARAAAAGLALVALAIGVLVWALPRLAESEAARARIQAASRSMLGRELAYGALDFGLFPPSLIAIEPSLAGEADGAPPLARADRVALRVELWPLLRRELQVSSLVVEGLAVHLVRTSDGVVLPKPDAGGDGTAGEPAGSPPPGDEPASPEDEDAGIALGIRTVALRAGSLVLEDRTASPPVTWRVEGVDVTARGSAPGDPIALDGALQRVGGGALEVAGPLAFEADLERTGSGAAGPFSIDATAADIRYGADFKKPAGTRAALRGKLTTASGAPGADDLVLELRNLVAKGALRSGSASALHISADPFALDGWEEIVPLLALAPLSGRVAIPKLELTGNSGDARGLVVLDGLEAHPKDTAPLALSGELVLNGATLRTRDAVLRAAEQSWRLNATVEQLFTAPRYEVAFETTAADSNALLAAYARQPDRLRGPLDAKGTLRGVISGERSFLDALSGDLAFDIEDGRIVGTSLLEAVLGSFGAKLAEASRGQGDQSWERFYSEEFEALLGTLRIADGRLVTAPITLRYRDYAAQLEGPIRLADLALDLTGTLTIEEALDAELARAFGARDDYVPERRTVSLAAVRGTLSAPVVQLASSSLANLAAAYATNIEREELKRRVEKELGAGSGEIVDQGLDVLEGLLGGGGKR